jgi:lysozyme family protein
MPTAHADLFHRAFEITLGHEGGVSRDPKDRAGDGTGTPHTNLGITLKTVRSYDADGKLGAFLRDAFDVDDDGDIDSADVPGWTPETAAAFYRRFYWDEVQAFAFPFPIGLLLFDAAVNMGQASAVRTLQVTLGVTADGAVGPVTIKAAQRRIGDDAFLGKFLAQRLEANRRAPTANDHFLGWARRAFAIHLEALKH